MAQFSVNARQNDPYRSFRFKVKVDGEYVAGLNKCSALKKTVEMVEWRDGGDPVARKLPGKVTYDAVTLESGMTHDTVFEDWANLVHDFNSGAPGMSLKDYRKDIVIDVFNIQGSQIFSYLLYRCWVSEYTALPELDASANSVAIQNLKLECEGWERDDTVTEPTET